MVDIVLGGIPPVQNKSNERQGREQPRKKKRPEGDRRKSESARREEERFGVVITLSGKDRERTGDRSEAQTYHPFGG